MLGNNRDYVVSTSHEPSNQHPTMNEFLFVVYSRVKATARAQSIDWQIEKKSISDIEKDFSLILPLVSCCCGKDNGILIFCLSSPLHSLASVELTSTFSNKLRYEKSCFTHMICSQCC